MWKKLKGAVGEYAGIAPLLSIYVFFGFAQAANEFRVLFLESLGMTPTECGRVLATAGLLTAISRPLAGALADKLRSRRIVYIGALICWMLVLALMLLTQQVQLAGFFLCAGIVPLISVFEPVTYGMVEASGVNATVQNPKLDFSLIRVCLSVGYSLINFLYTPIVNRFGPAAPFACTMLFVAVMLVLSGSMRRFETASIVQKQSTERNKLQIGRLFQNYYLISFVLLNFVLSLGSHTQSYLCYLIDAIGLDSSLVGVAIGIRVVGEIIIMPLVPLLKKWISLPMLQILACAFRILQMILFVFCKNPAVIMCGTVLNGFAGGVSLASTAVYLRMMAPKGLDTTTLSMSTAMSNVGGIAINLIGGMIVDSMGVFSLYRFSLGFLFIWLILYCGTWAFGVYVLRKKPPMPMFLKKTCET